jgi:hypothetical protein
LFGAWRAEWPQIAAALTVSFLLFLIPTAFASVRNWLWPPPVAYPIVCTAEPVWRGGTKRLVEIYLVNTANEAFTSDQLSERLGAALGESAKDASTGVFFPYQEGRPRAESAVADKPFNSGKGELEVQLTDRGVRVRPLDVEPLAILRVNVLFPVDDDSVEFDRGAKGTAGMLDLERPQAGCFTR